jgi:uncharacterized protein (DUF433 family)
MSYQQFIDDRGRGPEIKGTRITVYSILDFVIEGWHPERIAEFFRVHPEEVEAAWDYIRAHTLDVLREYVKMLERSERGNPPELQAKLDARHDQFLQLVARVRAAKARGETDISALIQEYRDTPVREASLAQNHGRQ